MRKTGLQKKVKENMDDQQIFQTFSSDAVGILEAVDAVDPAFKLKDKSPQPIEHTPLEMIQEITNRTTVGTEFLREFYDGTLKSYRNC